MCRIIKRKYFSFYMYMIFETSFHYLYNLMTVFFFFFNFFIFSLIFFQKIFISQMHITQKILIFDGQYDNKNFVELSKKQRSNLHVHNFRNFSTSLIKFTDNYDKK